MSTRRRVALASAALATTLAFATQPAHAATKAPSVRVIPDRGLHIGQDVTVVGFALTPDTAYTVAQCPRTLWVVPQNPCTATIQVTTNHAGRFRHRLHLAPCTTTSTVTCYIGIRHITGIDVVELDPHTAALTIRRRT